MRSAISRIQPTAIFHARKKSFRKICLHNKCVVCLHPERNTLKNRTMTYTIEIKIENYFTDTVDTDTCKTNCIDDAKTIVETLNALDGFSAEIIY